ncbi:MAG: hypothetical protein RI924_1151 [Bacteroidota bacterium]|jgi:hypothetical protein
MRLYTMAFIWLNLGDYGIFVRIAPTEQQA